MGYQEVITISETSVETYTRKIGEKEITVKNIRPQFQTEEERSNAKSHIMQTLYEVFSKYDEEC